MIFGARREMIFEKSQARPGLRKYAPPDNGKNSRSAKRGHDSPKRSN